MQDYAEVYSRLSYETAVITFLKKNGEARVMLATRNIRTAELQFGFLGGKLGGHDKRCNISNGNVAVIDLILGEARSFNISRVLDIQYAGQITTMERLNEVIEGYSKYKKEYESKIKGDELFSSIDTTGNVSDEDINNMFKGGNIND